MNEINEIFNGAAANIATKILPGYMEIMLISALAMLSGLSIRVMLTLVKQKWVSTYHHTMSYTLLPLITFVITKIITGNIALSLGMIGALSIVRFRNPVKNPFELVIFFALITIGIAMASNIHYGLMLAVVINMVIFISYLLEAVTRKFGLSIYSLSFDEGASHNVLEVETKTNIPYLDESIFLHQYVNNMASGIFHYRLSSVRQRDMVQLKSKLEKEAGVLSVELRTS
ncbi:hypothetical protein HOL24_02410 [bacterium]|jgi:hypothetical protein|nr:hypothetical protein [bacterium]